MKFAGNVLQFKPGGELSTTKLLAHFPQWDGGKKSKGKSANNCGLR